MEEIRREGKILNDRKGQRAENEKLYHKWEEIFERFSFFFAVESTVESFPGKCDPRESG